MTDDSLMRAASNEINEMLVNMGDLITHAVIDQVDHPALSCLREAYIALEAAYNVFDHTRIHRQWPTVEQWAAWKRETIPPTDEPKTEPCTEKNKTSAAPSATSSTTNPAPS